MKICQTIYLDHQATTPVDARVFEEMAPYFQGSFGNPHSVDHSIGWRSASAVDKAARRVAGLIGADPDEIFFTSGATEANNLALLGIGRREAGGKRRRVLVSAIEHKCVLTIGRMLHEQLGYRVDVLPVNAEGFLDLGALEDALSDDVLAVSIMAVNNEVGTVQNIAAISTAVKRSGAVFHCDAAQAPCAMDLGEISQHVDLLSLSGHKMYGPQGIGALFVRRDLQEKIEPMVYGGGQQRELRSGTVPVALCAGMGAAAKAFNIKTAQEERSKLRIRTDTFIGALMKLSWQVSLNGPVGCGRHPGNANLRFHGFDARDVLGALQPHLAASTGSACSTGIAEPSHVLRALGLSREDAESSIRFSLGRKTTEANLEEATTLIDRCLSRLADARQS